MGLVQDALLTARLLTRRGVFLNREQVYTIALELARTGDAVDAYVAAIPPPAVLLPVELWTGAQLVSMLLPDDTHFERTANGEPDSEVEDALAARAALCTRLAATEDALHAGAVARAVALKCASCVISEREPWSGAAAQMLDESRAALAAGVAHQRAAAALRRDAADKREARVLAMSPSNTRVLVRSGELLRGTLDKRSVGFVSRARCARLLT